MAASKRTGDGLKAQVAPSDADLAGRIAELLEAVRARDEFLAIAAHELRNPMTPISGQVELLLGEARRHGASPAIVRGLERLERLVDTYIKRTMVFLDVARITSGNLQLDCKSLDLSQLLQDLTRSLMPAAGRAGCRLEASIAEEVVVWADPLAAEQIVENLLMNALKYGAGRPVELTLAAEDGHARTTVRDHGGGIAADDQSRIFEKFERAVSHHNRQGGFGVGLWISNQLASAMGGRIDISSAVGVGSTFTLIVPLAK